MKFKKLISTSKMQNQENQKLDRYVNILVMLQTETIFCQLMSTGILNGRPIVSKTRVIV